jgi:hypothetical protein
VVTTVPFVGTKTVTVTLKKGEFFTGDGRRFVLLNSDARADPETERRYSGTWEVRPLVS